MGVGTAARSWSASSTPPPSPWLPPLRAHSSRSASFCSHTAHSGPPPALARHSNCRLQYDDVRYNHIISTQTSCDKSSSCAPWTAPSTDALSENKQGLVSHSRCSYQAATSMSQAGHPQATSQPCIPAALSIDLDRARLCPVVSGTDGGAASQSMCTGSSP